MLVFLCTDYFLSEFFFICYCDGHDCENPTGNTLCEGSPAKLVINTGHVPHFNILVGKK